MRTIKDGLPPLGNTPLIEFFHETHDILSQSFPKRLHKFKIETIKPRLL